jgi:hypothetical protein
MMPLIVVYPWNSPTKLEFKTKNKYIEDQMERIRKDKFDEE